MSGQPLFDARHPVVPGQVQPVLHAGPPRVGGCTDKHRPAVLLHQLVEDGGGGPYIIIILSSSLSSLSSSLLYYLHYHHHFYLHAHLDQRQRSLQRVLDGVHLGPVEVGQVRGREVVRQVAAEQDVVHLNTISIYNAIQYNTTIQIYIPRGPAAGGIKCRPTRCCRPPRTCAAPPASGQSWSTSRQSRPRSCWCSCRARPSSS